jgi:hypothetical protein
VEEGIKIIAKEKPDVFADALSVLTWPIRWAAFVQSAGWHDPGELDRYPIRPQAQFFGLFSKNYGWLSSEHTRPRLWAQARVNPSQTPC